MNQKYKKNRDVKFRKNTNGYTIYSLKTRMLVNLNEELFLFWNNIEDIEKYLLSKKISNSSFQNIIQTLLFYNLIEKI